MYLLLNTTTFRHDDNMETCRQHGLILPEPRSQEENDFLHNLNTDMFVLGMSDVTREDSWVWDSDGSPVIYTNWGSREPNGGREENCAVMEKFEVENWADIPCASRPRLDLEPKILICQKYEGMYLLWLQCLSCYWY